MTIPKRLLKFGLSALAVLCILGGVVAVAIAARAGDAPAMDGPGSEPLAVNTHPIAWEPGYEVERHFVGRVEARRNSDLGFEIGGMVVQLFVDEGQSVDAGETIAALDTKLLNARRAERLAALNQAKADYELAKLTKTRTLGTADRGAATQQEIDNVLQNYQAASAVLASAQASVESIDVEIGKARIAAPFDAVVARRYIDEGRVIAQGSPVVLLLERRSPEVRVGIGGDLIDTIRVGQTLDVRVRDQTLAGAVTALLPERSSESRSVDTLVRLDAELNGIRSGDLARVTIPSRVESSGFWVPTQALTEGIRGLWSVYLVEPSDGPDEILKRIDVEVLSMQGDRVYVRGALESGDRIVADGLQRLAPGMTVRSSDARAADKSDEAETTDATRTAERGD
ncbi:MAG: efflux RND transporter periplasmic adaptor subunit [Phycisphaeraceae bacterium]